MLRASIAFTVLGICALLLGQVQVAGMTFELGRLLLFVCLALAVVTFIGSLAPSKPNRT